MSSMVMPAFASARCEATTGPRPMISGDNAVTPVATIRASGVIPSALAAWSDMTTTAAAPSLSGQQLPAVTVPSGRNTGFRPARTSTVVPGRGPSSVLTTRPSGRVTGVISRSKKPSAMAFSARFCERAPNSSWSWRVVPRSGVVCLRVDLGAAAGALLRLGEAGVHPRVAEFVPRVGAGRRRRGVGVALDVPRHALHAGGHERVALPRSDRVKGHPGGLEARRAVPGHGRARQVVVPEQHGHHARHVEALLPARHPAAEHEVVEPARVELRHLVEGGTDDPRRQVVGPQLLERPLVRTADGRAGGGDDHGLGHGVPFTRVARVKRGEPARSSSPTPYPRAPTVPARASYLACRRMLRSTQAGRSRRSMAAAIRSGKASGVQAKAGTPRPASAAALSRSNEGAPSSDSASSAITCTPAAVIAATRRSTSWRIPPS